MSLRSGLPKRVNELPIASGILATTMPGANDITDAQIASCVAGSKKEIEQVLGAIEPQVRLMVAARLCASPRQHHAVEEITHLVMVGLSQGIHRLKNRTVGGLRAFASVIATRKVSDFLNRRGGGDLVGPALRSLDSTVTALSGRVPHWQILTGSGASPSSVAAQTEECAAVLKGLSGLKHEHREVITLAIFDQLPTREIADRMDISRPAASMLLIRAIKTLRRNLTGSSRLEGQDEWER